MFSKKTKKTIADLDEFLKYKHPSSVFQFITGMMVGWTHFDEKNPPSRSDIDLAWHEYFISLRNNIDGRLVFIASQSYSMPQREQKVLSIPPHVYEKKKLDNVVTLLGSMPADEALDFIVEVTTNWCFSIPISFLPLVPVTFQGNSDEIIANAIYEWLIMYCDFGIESISYA